MKEGYAKLISIVGEITDYFLRMNSRDISSNIKIHDDHSEIIVHAKDLTITEHRLESIKMQLNNPRQKEVEGYYWGLAGSEHEGAELRLVGTMVDTAEVSSDNENGTIVKVKRY